MSSHPLETGLPLMRSFNPKEYGAAPQNWAIVQDPRGVMYVGNNNGVLEFDGQHWRLIPVVNQTAVHSLAVDAAGRVYVGAVGEVGYLAPDTNGQMHYVSLLDRIPLADRDFAKVWSTHTTSQGVVFSSVKRLMRWQGERLLSWAPSTRFGIAFRAGERLFVVEAGRGLLELVGDELRLVTGGERYAEDTIDALLPIRPVTTGAAPPLLIASRKRGFSLFDEGGFRPWPTAIDAELKRDELMFNSVARLHDGRLALGTMRGGLYLLDLQGHLVGQLRKADGLLSETVAAMFADREGALWLGLSHGLMRVELNNPLSRFDERNGLHDAVLAVHRHQGRLFAATNQGVYRLESGPRAHFQKLPGIEGQTWAFLSMDDALLAANNRGVYLIRGDACTLVLDAFGASSLLLSKARPGLVYVGLSSGLALLQLDQAHWRDDGRVPGISDYVRTLYEDDASQLWLGTYNTGVVRLRMAPVEKNSPAALAQVDRFGTAQGLPSLNYNLVYPIDGEARFATSAGIYRYDKQQNHFEPDPRFATLFAQPRVVYVAHQDPTNQVWMYAEDTTRGLKETGLARHQAAARGAWDGTMLSALNGHETMSTYGDPNGVVWFGSDDGLFRFDPRVPKNYAQPHTALLRKVSGREGKVHYGGGGEPARPVLLAADNALRFEYAAPSFDGKDPLQFQVRLEGSDADWSDWSAEKYKDYNNLFEGDYRFHVRAKNLYGTLSQEGVYGFSVLPPWYRTFWAYLAYLAALAGSAWGVMRWRLRRLQAQKVALEATVAERTQQIATLGEVGRAVTAQLELDAALDTLYAQLNRMLDASVFTIGLYHPERDEIEFRLAIENDRRLPPYVCRMDDKTQLAVCCIERGEPILIGDYPRECSRYLTSLDNGAATLADDHLERPMSMLYVPLSLKGRTIGVLSVQSFKARAYDASHLDILQTLAAYAATAIDNARAHEQLGLQATALQATNEKLVTLDGFKQGMMGMIVHDLKNPLNVILTTLDSPSLQSRLALLRQSARQMLTLVLNILDVQKFEDTAMVVDKEHCNVAELAAKAVEQVRFLSERKNITLSVQLPIGLAVRCDAEMIERVWVNLLTNAVKYTPHNGHIVLSAELTAGQFVRLQVQDSGEGIPASKLDTLFLKFGQHKARSSGNVRSTGLGLNFCKLAVEAHGGQIGVESEPGVGSTFWFTLAAGDTTQGHSLGDAAVPTSSSNTPTLSLTEADRALLAPFVPALKSLAIYRYTDLHNILKRADFPSNARIDTWRKRVETTIETENSAQFDVLLTL